MSSAGGAGSAGGAQTPNYASYQSQAPETAAPIAQPNVQEAQAVEQAQVEQTGQDTNSSYEKAKSVPLAQVGGFDALGTADQADRVKGQASSNDLKVNMQVNAAVRAAMQAAIRGAMEQIRQAQSKMVDTTGLKEDKLAEANAKNAAVSAEIDKAFTNLNNIFETAARNEPQSFPKGNALRTFIEEMQQGRKNDGEDMPGVKKGAQKPIQPQQVTTGLNVAQEMANSVALAAQMQASQQQSAERSSNKKAGQSDDEGGVQVGGGGL